LQHHLALFGHSRLALEVILLVDSRIGLVVLRGGGVTRFYLVYLVLVKSYERELKKELLYKNSNAIYG
jgi:hypothetical protein